MTSSATPARNFPRVFVAGTDTGVGKTEVCCALIRAARRRNLRALPFKPAQSGDERPTDAERLARAAQHPSLSVDDIAPLRYERALAPGMAQDMSAYLDPAAPQDLSHLAQVERHLDALEARHDPDLVIIEGAGGLFVPMPGGTWQPRWLERLGGAVVLVVRPSLGTINHTWLTLHALETCRVSVAGIVINDGASEDASADDSVSLNRQILASRPDAPLLGSFPRRGDRPTPAAEDHLFDALWSRLQRAESIAADGDVKRASLSDTK